MLGLPTSKAGRRRDPSPVSPSPDGGGAVSSAPVVAAAAAAGYQEIASGKLFPSRTNPRKHFSEAKLREMADTIRSHGIVQPLVVRPAGAGTEFEIVAGERRWRASYLAGLTLLPCIVRTLSDDQVLDIQTIENLQREDLEPLEEADGYQALLDRGLYTASDLAAKLGKSESYIYGRLKLRGLSEEARAELANPESRFTLGHATVVSRLPRLADQKACLDHVLNHWTPVSPAALRAFVRDKVMRILGAAIFPLDDASLLADAGSCTTCPKRTGSQAALFSDVSEEEDRCLDLDCFAMKGRNFIERKRAELEQKGQPVVVASTFYGSKKQKGIVGPADWDECKKSEPGAVRAVIADGVDAGKVQWVKLRERGKDAAPTPSNAGWHRKQLAAREDRRKLEQLYAAKLVDALIDRDLTSNGALRGYLLSNVSSSLHELGEEFYQRCGYTKGYKIAQHEVVCQELARGDTLLSRLLEAELLSMRGGWDMDRLVEVAREEALDVKGLEAEAKAEIKAAAAAALAEDGNSKKKPAKKKAAKKT